jgi:hypothetical protein
MPDTVSAMKFGKFGREDSSLVLVTVGGSLTVKILKRTAQFEKMETAMGPASTNAVIATGGNKVIQSFPKKVHNNCSVHCTIQYLLLFQISSSINIPLPERIQLRAMSLWSNDFAAKKLFNRSKNVSNRLEIDFCYLKMYNRFKNDPNTIERAISPERVW